MKNTWNEEQTIESVKRQKKALYIVIPIIAVISFYIIASGNRLIEREINRLGNVKGSEDILGMAIDMARKGEDRESIKKKTGLREDEVEAIYTYYRK